MFKMIDSDNGGQITYEEIKVGLQKVGANLEEFEISAQMEAADINNSGTINYREFIVATLQLNKVEREGHQFAAFSYCDKDGIGIITANELLQPCENFGIINIKLEDMIQEIDQDNNGKINYNEFVEMIMKGNAEFGKKGLHNNIGFREAMNLG